MENHEAHVIAYDEHLDALHWEACCAQMAAAEGRWVDAGCPSNGFYDEIYD